MIAATFCAFIIATMLYQHARATQRDPWKSPQLLTLKEQLRAQPTDEAIKAEIRRLDLEFRQRYFRRLSLNQTGGWLLVGGMVALLFVARSRLKLFAQPHLPTRRTDDAQTAARLSTQARWSVAAVGGVTLAGLATLVFTSRSALPQSAAELDKLLGRGPEEAIATLPSLAEFQANWPRFRGWDGNGATTARIGTNIIWSSPIPSWGFNSPIVWGDRLFLSGGDAKEREVLCYNSTTGNLLWQRPVANLPGSPARQPDVPEMTGFAAATMATDGQRAFVIFANGDLAAYNFDGSLAWGKNIGVPRNMYGHASSLAVWPGALIVQLDQDEHAPGGSKLLAFDCATGRQLWERRKPTHDSWASPIVIEAAGKVQIITLAMPLVMSHALADGNELWRAHVMEGEVAPSPILANGNVVLISPAARLLALRPGGAGDITASHVAWENDDNLPDITSPVAQGDLVFLVSSMGFVTCVSAADGQTVWEKELEFEVQASPAIAGGQLLIVGTKGDVVQVEAAREFKELGRLKLPDEFHASPAFAGERMFLRGTTNLWCLGGRNHE
ncbi:MAG TPA: PQQ-binding-like beta-propeller repeat protein [Verrucomicrobiota bacterium]|nr:PQQ-binding-like beta-propeller repeat protein [Verrucomicrobiota bacterium]